MNKFKLIYLYVFLCIKAENMQTNLFSSDDITVFLSRYLDIDPVEINKHQRIYCDDGAEQ